MDSLKKAMPVRVQITAILRKALFSGEYKSGDELSLTETAERLGVSRTLPTTSKSWKLCKAIWTAFQRRNTKS